MGEIRKLHKKESKPFKTLGGSESKQGKGVEIITNSPQPKIGGTPTVLDRNSPVEEPQAEVHIHADRGSYKEALKKDD